MVSQQSDRFNVASTTAFRSTLDAAPLPDASRLLDLPHPRSAKLVHALLAGFIASLALLIVFALAYALALTLAGALPSDRPVVAIVSDWFRGLTRDPLLDRALPNPFIAVGLFTVGGIAWALLYAAVFEPLLTGPDWHRGLVFGFVPWLFSLGVFMPLVGGGFFGLGLGAGPLPIVGNLVLHAVYGVVLARLYGPFGQMLDTEQHLPAEARKAALACCESAAVRGLGVGVLLGGLLGGTVLLIASEKGGAPFLGIHPLGVLLEAILSGASVGASAGALVGCPADDGR